MERKGNAPLKHFTWRRGAEEMGSPQGCAINIVPGNQAKWNFHLGGLIWGFPLHPAAIQQWWSKGTSRWQREEYHLPPQPGSALLPIPRSPNKARGIWGEEFVYLQHLELEEVSLSDSETTGDVRDQKVEMSWLVSSEKRSVNHLDMLTLSL